MDYDFLQIEKKWQDIWSTKKTFKADSAFVNDTSDDGDTGADSRVLINA